MALKQIEPPALEPVSLDEAKLYLRVDTSAEDDAITLLIAASRGLFERETGLILLRQSWQLTLDKWPVRGADSHRRVYLPLRPVLSVASAVVSVGGVAVNIPDTDYHLDAEASPPRLIEQVAGLWPKPDVPAAGITVDFDAGFGDAADAVPAPLRLVVLKLVAEAYENRGVIEAGAALTPGVIDLLAPFREVRL
ncbi:MAG: hypothetical protein WAW96_19075 [Alphaproteobacteria bacterium]